MSDGQIRTTASIGLIIGAIFGMAGSFVSSASYRGLAWGLDGAGLLFAGALLTIYFFRKGHDAVAAGFLIFAIGEGFILSCSASNPDEDISSFAAGTSLWAASIMLISIQNVFPKLVRVIGFIAAILFAIVSVRIFIGNTLNPLSKPMPFYFYPFLAATIVGWAWTLLRKDSFPKVDKEIKKDHL